MQKPLWFLGIIFSVLLCYLALAEFSGPGNAFGMQQLHNLKIADSGWFQIQPKSVQAHKTPVTEQQVIEVHVSATPTPKSISGDKKPEPSEPKKVPPPVQTGEGNNQVVSNPSVLPSLLLVNKEKGLSPAYKPQDLTVPDIPFSFTEDLPKKQLAAPAARALEKLFAAAQTEGIELVGVSGYRSYATQQAVFQQHVNTTGREEAERISAPPGYSEHQTGLAIDVSSPSVNNQLVEEFGDTPEGRWLAENASQYGFIVRYLKDKEEVTGYRYEPWHIRYVGEQFAEAITDKSLTLEDFMNESLIAQN